MGDVLLTLPVLRGVLRRNPSVELVFVTRKKFAPYFEGIDRLIAIPFDPEIKHKGLIGLLRLFIEIRKYSFRQVVDLHGILRTHVLDVLLLLAGCRISKIRKYRRVRQQVLKNKLKDDRVLHTTERYLEVFEKAGLKGEVGTNNFRLNPVHSQFTGTKSDMVKIGIAPLSKHSTKNWGLNNIAELIRLLRLRYLVEIHLFGGKEDYQLLNALAGQGVLNHAGNLGSTDEVNLISTMNVFVSMDSANMHLASLLGVPTVSVWGATDPVLGFAPLFQPDSYAIRASSKEVICRPCSVYGEKPCKRTDSPMICMNSIKPEVVVNKIKEILILTNQK
jgi:ADP-heptose:LPS heptosyltransferase